MTSLGLTEIETFSFCCKEVIANFDVSCNNFIIEISQGKVIGTFEKISRIFLKNQNSSKLSQPLSNNDAIIVKPFVLFSKRK
jgi:hypothetical protein